MRLSTGRFPVFLLSASALCALAVSSCGSASTAGPLGTPDQVVGAAPDATLGMGTAKILITAPSANATGTVDLGGRNGALSVSAPGNAKPADVLIVAGRGYVKAVGDPGYIALPGAMPSVL